MLVMNLIYWDVDMSNKYDSLKKLLTGSKIHHQMSLCHLLQSWMIIIPVLLLGSL